MASPHCLSTSLPSHATAKFTSDRDFKSLWGRAFFAVLYINTETTITLCEACKLLVIPQGVGGSLSVGNLLLIFYESNILFLQLASHQKESVFPSHIPHRLVYRTEDHGSFFSVNADNKNEISKA